MTTQMALHFLYLFCHSLLSTAVSKREQRRSPPEKDLDGGGPNRQTAEGIRHLANLSSIAVAPDQQGAIRLGGGQHLEIDRCQDAERAKGSVHQSSQIEPADILHDQATGFGQRAIHPRETGSKEEVADGAISQAARTRIAGRDHSADGGSLRKRDI